MDQEKDVKLLENSILKQPANLIDMDDKSGNKLGLLYNRKVYLTIEILKFAKMFSKLHRLIASNTRITYLGKHSRFVQLVLLLIYIKKLTIVSFL